MLNVTLERSLLSEKVVQNNKYKIIDPLSFNHNLKIRQTINDHKK